MSFHAYLRQLNSSQQKAPSAAITNSLPTLEEQNFKVKVPCTGGHAPWPEGICSKCQPSSITLQSQVQHSITHIKKRIDELSHLFRTIVWWTMSSSPRLH
jgi:nuclear protein localization family protein 4